MVSLWYAGYQRKRQHLERLSSRRAFPGPYVWMERYLLIPTNHAWLDAFLCPATPKRTLYQIGTPATLANWQELIPDLRYEDLHFIDLPNRYKKIKLILLLLSQLESCEIRWLLNNDLLILLCLFIFFRLFDGIARLFFTKKYQVWIPPNCSVFSASPVLPLTFALLPKIRIWWQMTKMYYLCTL